MLNRDELRELVSLEAARQGVDPALAVAVAQQESGFNPTARSKAGAYGIMQLMPGTATTLGVDRENVADNIFGGIKYLRQQLGAFGGNVSHALAAYNAGPEAVKKYGGVPPYQETQGYVQRILGSLGPRSAEAATPRQSPQQELEALEAVMRQKGELGAPAQAPIPAPAAPQASQWEGGAGTFPERSGAPPQTPQATPGPQDASQWEGGTSVEGVPDAPPSLLQRVGNWLTQAPDTAEASPEAETLSWLPGFEFMHPLPAETQTQIAADLPAQVRAGTALGLSGALTAGGTAAGSALGGPFGAYLGSIWGSTAARMLNQYLGLEEPGALEDWAAVVGPAVLNLPPAARLALVKKLPGLGRALKAIGVADTETAAARAAVDAANAQARRKAAEETVRQRVKVAERNAAAQAAHQTDVQAYEDAVLRQRQAVRDIRQVPERYQPEMPADVPDAPPPTPPTATMGETPWHKADGTLKQALKDTPEHELEIQQLVRKPDSQGRKGIMLADEELFTEYHDALSRSRDPLATGERASGGLINDTSGLTTQQMAERAAEHGFIDEADTNLLKEALDKSTRGTPVYSKYRTVAEPVYSGRAELPPLPANATVSQRLYRRIEELGRDAPVDMAFVRERVQQVAEELGPQIGLAPGGDRVQGIITAMQGLEVTDVRTVSRYLKELTRLARSPNSDVRYAASQAMDLLHDALFETARQLPETRPIANLVTQARTAYRREKAVETLQDILRTSGQAVKLDAEGREVVNVRAAMNALEKELNPPRGKRSYFAGAFTPEEQAQLRAEFRSFRGTPDIPRTRPVAPVPEPLPGRVAPDLQPYPAAVEPRLPWNSLKRASGAIGASTVAGALSGQLTPGVLAGGAIATVDIGLDALAQLLLTPRGRQLLRWGMQQAGRDTLTRRQLGTLARLAGTERSLPPSAAARQQQEQDRAFYRVKERLWQQQRDEE